MSEPLQRVAWSEPERGWLDGKNIVLGVTGGIAAYKAIEVCRRLVDAGAHVAPIMTAGAKKMVGETTFSALASEQVRTTLWNEDTPIPHTRLGQGADAIVVCPATARLIGSYVGGISAGLLTATLLATRAPVVVCPAMHTEMWEHPAVQDNLRTLRHRGVRIVDPESGRLAGGDLGHGRLAAPEKIVAMVEQAVADQDLAGRRVLVTAGGTREAIDPVRFLGNRSTGRQGHAVAAEAAARGAEVVLVTTSELSTPPGVRRVDVVSAADMHDAVHEEFGTSDALVMTAAVADFRPARTASEKIKKTGAVPDLLLERTVDILASVGDRKRPGQTVVGFAAETTDVATHAADKLTRKNADFIVANDVSAAGTGFAHATNEVAIFRRSGAPVLVPLRSKRGVARVVLDLVADHQGSSGTPAQVSSEDRQGP